MQTHFLKLPFLVPDQAQKHVTVNESLRRLDSLVQARVIATGATSPPSAPEEGAGYILSAQANGAWAGHGGEMAVFTDGSWMFFTPQTGWRVWDDSQSQLVVFNGSAWVGLIANGGQAGSDASSSSASVGRDLPDGLEFVQTQIDHTIRAGTYNDTNLIIRDRDMVLGITGRVLTSLTGNQQWRLGVSADANRYSTYIGGVRDSIVQGLASTPLTYYQNTPIRISAQSGSLQAGKIRLRLYVMRLALPPA